MVISSKKHRAFIFIFLFLALSLIGCGGAEGTTATGQDKTLESLKSQLAVKEEFRFDALSIDLPSKWCDMGIMTKDGFIYSNSGFLNYDSSIVEPDEPFEATSSVYDESLSTGVSILIRISRSNQFDVKKAAEYYIESEVSGMPPEIAKQESEKYWADIQENIEINGNKASIVEIDYTSPEGTTYIRKQLYLFVPNINVSLSALITVCWNHDCDFTEEQTKAYGEGIHEALTDSIKTIGILQ